MRKIVIDWAQVAEMVVLVTLFGACFVLVIGELVR